MRVAGLVLAALLVASSAAATPTADLDKGRSAYKAGDWDSALKTLNSLIYPNIELARREDIWEAYVLLGASAYHLGNRDRAVNEFRRALNIELDHSITTNVHTPDVVQLFEDTKARVKGELELEQKKREAEDQKRRIREYLDTIGVYETNSYGYNFLPFGAGQFQNKQRGKGYLVAGGMAVTGATSVGIFMYLGLKYGLSAKVPLLDGPRVRQLQQIEVGTGAVFFGFYIYSVIDAMVNFKSTRLVKGDDSLIPPDLIDPSAPPRKPPPKKAKKTSLRDRLHIGPLLTPTGVGLGLGWETD